MKVSELSGILLSSPTNAAFGGSMGWGWGLGERGQSSPGSIGMGPVFFTERRRSGMARE